MPYAMKNEDRFVKTMARNFNTDMNMEFQSYHHSILQYDRRRVLRF
jgi:hypothetical protein